MVFKKATWIHLQFKGTRDLEITKGTRYDDSSPRNNDRSKTFDGPDTDKGDPEPTLTIEQRFETNKQLPITIRNKLEEVDEDGFTILIQDGDHRITYSRCFPSNVQWTHSADGKPTMTLDVDVDEVKAEYVPRR